MEAPPLTLHPPPTLPPRPPRPPARPPARLLVACTRTRFTVLYFNFFRFLIFFFVGQCSNAGCCDTSRARCCQLTFYPSSFPLSFSRHGNLTPNSPNGISPFSFGELPSIQRLKLLAIRRPREDRKKKEGKKKEEERRSRSL